MLGTLSTLNVEAVAIIAVVVLVLVAYFVVSRRPSFEAVYDEKALRILASDSAAVKAQKSKKSKKKDKKNELARPESTESQVENVLSSGVETVPSENINGVKASQRQHEKKVAKSLASESEDQIQESLLKPPSSDHGKKKRKSKENSESSNFSSVTAKTDSSTVNSVKEVIDYLGSSQPAYREFLLSYSTQNTQKIANLQKELDIKNCDFHDHELKMAEVQSRIAELEEENLRKKWEYSNLESLFTAKRKEFDERSKELSALRRQMESEMKKRESIHLKQAECEQSNNEWRQRYESEKKSKTVLEEDIDHLNRKIASLELDLLAKEEKKQELLKEVNKFADIKHANEREKMELIQKCASLNETIKNIMSDGAQVNDKVIALEQELSRMVMERESSKCIQQDLTAVKEELGRISNDRDAQLSKARNLEDKMKLVSEENESLRKQLLDFEEKLDQRQVNMLRSVSSKEAEESTAPPAVADDRMNAELQRLRQSYEQIMNDLKVESFENKDLLAKFDVYKQEQAKYNKKIMANYNALKVLVDELNDEVKNFELQKKQLAEQAKLYEAANEELTKLRKLQSRCEENFKRMEVLEEENRKLKELCSTLPTATTASKSAEVFNDDPVVRKEAHLTASSNTSSEDTSELKRRLAEIVQINDSLTQKVAELRERNANIVEQAMKGKEAVALIDALNNTVGKASEEKLSPVASLAEIEKWLSRLSSDAAVSNDTFVADGKGRLELRKEMAELVNLLESVQRDTKRSQKIKRVAQSVKTTDREGPENMSDWELL